MISKKVRVNVYGMLADGLYSGYAASDNIKNRSAYIISKKPLRDYMYGVVIAVVTIKGAGEKLIVAPEGEIYYEPAIREKLSHLRNAQIEKISCLYEKSCGAIVIYKDGDKYWMEFPDSLMGRRVILSSFMRSSSGWTSRRSAAARWATSNTCPSGASRRRERCLFAA